jgi:hypothetical protein
VVGFWSRLSIGKSTKVPNKGIVNRARQLSTPEAPIARPNCNDSRYTSSYRMSIL